MYLLLVGFFHWHVLVWCHQPLLYFLWRSMYCLLLYLFISTLKRHFFLVLVSRIIAFFRVVIVFYLRNIMNHVNNLGFCFLATGELRAKSVVCTSLISGLILCSFHFCSLIYFEHLLLVYFRYPCRLSQITSGISLIMCTWAVHCPLFPHL